MDDEPIRHVADASAARTKAALLDVLARALSFPDYFGRNLDALYDCLTDLSWLPAGRHVLVLTGTQTVHEADQKGYRAVMKTVADAVSRMDGRLSVVVR